MYRPAHNRVSLRALALRIVPLGLALVLAAGCGNYSTSIVIHSIYSQNPNLMVGASTQIFIDATTLPGRTLTYTVIPDRGRVDQYQGKNNVVTYFAPFTSRAPDASGNLVQGDRLYVRVDDGVGSVEQTIPINLSGNTVVVEVPRPDTPQSGNGNLMIGAVDDTGFSVTSLSPLTDVTGKPVSGAEPAISPDGRKIAYTFYPGDGTSNIYTIDAERETADLTGSGNGLNVDPTWSPSSKELAFASNRDGDVFNLYRIGTEQPGGQAIRVTHDAVDERYPAWNPNPQMINTMAFAARTDDEHNLGTSDPTKPWNIFLLDIPSGTITKRMTNLTQQGDYAIEPSWRPDGSVLAYTYNGPVFNSQSDAARYQKVYVQEINLGPGNGRPLNSGNNGFTTTKESAPVWNPDGNDLAFVAQDGGGVRILRQIYQPGGTSPQIPQIWAGLSLSPVPMVYRQTENEYYGGRPIAWR